MASMRLALLMSVIAVATGACVGTATAPPLSMTATTLMSGWEQHFSIEWAASQGRGGTHRVTGYIYNRHGEYALDVRVLAQAMDQSGTVIGQRIAFVPGGVGGLAGAYFEVPNLPVASTYRVSVWDYSWAQSGDKH